MEATHQIRQNILNGHLKDGDQLPPAPQIAESYSLEENTVAQVLAALRAAGIAESVPDSGTVVRTRRTLHRSAKDRLNLCLDSGRIYPEGEYARIIAAELVSAPAWVADVLSIQAGTRALRRHRVTYNEGGPISVSTSWFTEALAQEAPALAQTERISGGTLGVIAAATGREIVGVDEASSAGQATADQARELGVDQGAPVLISRNLYYDTEGVVQEAGESVAPEGRWKMHT